MTSLLSIKLILEANANNFHCETLRILGKYNDLAQSCKGIWDKLYTAQNRLTEIKKEIKGEILFYLEIALTFFRAYCLWAISKNNKGIIELE